MGFRTVNFFETLTDLLWEVEWDGRAEFTAHTEDRSYWNTSIVVANRPAGSGSVDILGVDVTGRHKTGPHAADVSPARQVSFRMDPLQILSDFGTEEVERGNQTLQHAQTSGAPHEDVYRCSTFRLHGQSGVKIILRATHRAPMVTGQPATGVAGTAPGGGVAVQPATPALEPPRKGKAKSFTFVEESDSDNGYNWASGAVRIGEVDVESVKDMVDHVLENLGEDECIGELTIIGHGCPGNISVGNGQSGNEAGKEINVFNPGPWRDELHRLRCKFCENSTVYLRGCNVGADDAGAELLQMLNEIFQCAGKIQAPTGLCRPLWTEGEDQTVNRGDREPPESLPNPEDGEKKKKKKTEGKKTVMIGGKPKDPVKFEPVMIDAARILLPGTGKPLTPEYMETDAALDCPEKLCGAFRSYLGGADLIDGANCGFKWNALVQFKIAGEGSDTWLPPMGITGGGRYLAPFIGKTDILYVLPEPLRNALGRFMTGC